MKKLIASMLFAFIVMPWTVLAMPADAVFDVELKTAYVLDSGMDLMPAKNSGMPMKPVSGDSISNSKLPFALIDYGAVWYSNASIIVPGAPWMLTADHKRGVQVPAVIWVTPKGS